jgi:general secretion pathway protein H
MIWRLDEFGSAKRDRERGFTLIELLVVIAILGLMAALVTIQGRPVSPATHARAAAQAIAGALRAARGEAIRTNRSVSFQLDVANRSYRWGRNPLETLPGDLGLELLTSRDQVGTSRVGQIRFDPDGGSSGGRVSVMGGGRLWWVGVDWLSGRVSVVQAEQ